VEPRPKAVQVPVAKDKVAQPKIEFSREPSAFLERQQRQLNFLSKLADQLNAVAREAESLEMPIAEDAAVRAFFEFLPRHLLPLVKVQDKRDQFFSRLREWAKMGFDKEYTLYLIRDLAPRWLKEVAPEFVNRVDQAMPVIIELANAWGFPERTAPGKNKSTTIDGLVARVCRAFDWPIVEADSFRARRNRTTLPKKTIR
jgi:hypothetical protein